MELFNDSNDNNIVEIEMVQLNWIQPYQKIENIFLIIRIFLKTFLYKSLVWEELKKKKKNSKQASELTEHNHVNFKRLLESRTRVPKPDGESLIIFYLLISIFFQLILIKSLHSHFEQLNELVTIHLH